MVKGSFPISVSMVSGAEAHRIRPALESVAGWTSEIIVVLNEDVTDGTDLICAEFGAKVFREPWKGFVGQKNSAAEKATQPWLLNIDADEVVSPQLAHEIQQSLGNIPESTGALQFPRCTFYMNRWIRHGDWYPDRVTRLWRRGRARWTGDEPHAALAVDGQTERLKSDLLHYSNESINRQIAKIAPYADGFVAGRLKAGRDPGLIDLAFRPWWTFFRAYVLKAGFLDGWPGYYIAWMSGFSTATRYAKVREARLAVEKVER
jgi:glycosyltransferase involved in cell wall biosynthesis